MKLAVLLTICMVAASAMGSVAYDPRIDVTLVPANQTVAVGDEFTLDFHLKDVRAITNDDDFHAQILLSFDSSKLELLGADGPASITSFNLFGTLIPEYIWHAPGSVTLNAGDDLVLPSMHFLALAPVTAGEIDIAGPFFNTPGNEAIKHNCDTDYTNSMTGATVTVSPVPEPITMVAAMAGLSGLGCYVRRRLGKEHGIQ